MRIKYSDKVKRQACALARRTTMAEASRRTGIGPITIRTWMENEGAPVPTSRRDRPASKAPVNLRPPKMVGKRSDTLLPSMTATNIALGRIAKSLERCVTLLDRIADQEDHVDQSPSEAPTLDEADRIATEELS